MRNPPCTICEARWLDSTIDTHELRGNLMVIEVNLAPPPTSRRGAHLVSGITQHHVLMLYVSAIE
jgi:hypothetical protein